MFAGNNGVNFTLVGPRWDRGGTRFGLGLGVWERTDGRGSLLSVLGEVSHTKCWALVSGLEVMSPMPSSRSV